MHSGYHESKFVCGVLFPQSWEGGFFFVVLRRVPGQSIRAACIAVVVAVHDGDLGEGWVADMLFRLGLSSEQRS
jgi:hypothetical protein